MTHECRSGHSGRYSRHQQQRDPDPARVFETFGCSGFRHVVRLVTDLIRLISSKLRAAAMHIRHPSVLHQGRLARGRSNQRYCQATPTVVKSEPVRVDAPVLKDTFTDWLAAIGSDRVAPTRALFWRLAGAPSLTRTSAPSYQVASAAAHIRRVTL